MHTQGGVLLKNIVICIYSSQQKKHPNMFFSPFLLYSVFRIPLICCPCLQLKFFYVSEFNGEALSVSLAFLWIYR